MREPRESSKSVFHQIKNEGLLQKLQLQVYSIIYRHGPLSARMAQEIFNEESTSEKHNDVVDQRFSELKKVGCIRELDKKQACESSGRMVLWWDVTENLPKKVKRSRTKTQISKEIVGAGKKLIKAWREKAAQDKKVKILLRLEGLLDEWEAA